ncbi:MAG TPA: zf-TFIIB domain-containing protein [Dehalococcoidia bacterium]|nr:zf-TFIIB domain-containing protein [Dehalococcoidia bacterium]
MQCPRCQVDLAIERHEGIEIDHCKNCNGRWIDHHELDELEAKFAPDPDVRKGTIQYAKRGSDLACPVCSKQMVAFNYRANPLEIDTCEEEHGFWLDAGEEGKLKDLVEDRVKGFARAVNAEQAWGEFLHGVGSKSVWDQIKGMFGGRRR